MESIKPILNDLLSNNNNNNIDEVKAKIINLNLNLNADDQKSLIEISFRDLLQDFIKSRDCSPKFENGEVIDHYHLALLHRLNILVDLLSNDLISANSLIPIISDTLDIHPLSSATMIFSFLRNFMSSDKSIPVRTISTRNNLLRTSNELLRRSSRTRNCDLCGEILLFLTSIMPLTDRSATNFRGDIRESFTHIPKEYYESEEVDDNYRNFWNLQSYLTNPMSIYNNNNNDNNDNESNLQKFKHYFSSTLNTLNEVSNKEIEMSGPKSEKRKFNDDIELQSEEYFFPEYLSTPKLFSSQLADPSFRRCVFLQMFMIIQFIISVSPEELLKGPEIQNGQEKVIKSGIQTDKDTLIWATNSRAEILKSLQKVSPHAFDYVTLLINLMKREKHWTYWKMENCPKIELPKASSELLDKSEENKLSNIFKSVQPCPYTYGTETLTESFEEGYHNERDLELYPQPPDLSHYVKLAKIDTMKAKRRRTTLGLEGDESNTQGDGELEYIKSHKQSLSWRGFRLVARNHGPIIASLPPGSDVEGLQNAIINKKNQQQQKNLNNNNIASSKPPSPKVHHDENTQQQSQDISMQEDNSFQPNNNNNDNNNTIDEDKNNGVNNNNNNDGNIDNDTQRQQSNSSEEWKEEKDKVEAIDEQK